MGIPTTIDNIDDFWKCEHERENEQNGWAGLILAFVGIFLITKYIDKYNKSSERSRSIARRQLDMTNTIKDHYLAVTHPQRVFSVTNSMSMPIPSISVDIADFKELDFVSRMQKQRDSLLKDSSSFCRLQSCRNSIEIAGSIAMADSSYSRKQFNLRRFERRTELKRRIVTKSHSASMQQSQAFFQLLNTAASIYSSIMQNAQQNLTGATGMLGQGLGMMGGGF